MERHLLPLSKEIWVGISHLVKRRKVLKRKNCVLLLDIVWNVTLVTVYIVLMMIMMMLKQTIVTWPQIILQAKASSSKYDFLSLKIILIFLF